MLDKFRCDFVVHFYGACFIPNHIMVVTEFAPSESQMDCTKKRPEPSEFMKAKLMLNAVDGALSSCTGTAFCTGHQAGQRPCLLARRGA